MSKKATSGFIIMLSTLLGIALLFAFILPSVAPAPTINTSPQSSAIVTGNYNFDSNSLVIDSMADLTTFKADVENSGRSFAGKTVYLAANINVTSGFNIGRLDNGCSFNGTFDGQNFTISNLTCYLFYGLEACTIQNLKLVTASTNTSPGILAYLLNNGYMSGNTINIFNVHTSGNSQSAGMIYFHTGESSTPDKTINFDSCTFTGTVSSNTSLGVAGLCYVYRANIVTNFNKCATFGTLTTTVARDMYGISNNKGSYNYCVSNMHTIIPQSLLSYYSGIGGDENSEYNYCINTGSGGNQLANYNYGSTSYGIGPGTAINCGSSAGIIAGFYPGNETYPAKYYGYALAGVAKNSWTLGGGIRADFPQICQNGGISNITAGEWSDAYAVRVTRMELQQRDIIKGYLGWADDEFGFASEGYTSPYLPPNYPYAMPLALCDTSTVTLNQNGGSISPTQYTATIYRGAEITLPQYTGTKEGFVFAGWSESLSPTLAQVYRAGDKYRALGETNTLYAVWSALDVNLLNTDYIKLNTVYRASELSSEGTVVATFTPSCIPRIWIGDSKFVDLTQVNSKGILGQYSYDYTLVNNVLKLNITGLTSGTLETVTLDIAGSTAYTVTANLDTTSTGTASVIISYDEYGGALINIIPAMGNYLASIYFGTGEPFVINATEGYVRDNVYNARYCYYVASNSANAVKLYLIELCGDVNVDYIISTYKPSLKEITPGAVTGNVQGIAVTSSLGGEARIVGDDYENGAADMIVTFVAVPYRGYSFAYWSINDEVIKNDDSQPYGASMRITKEDVSGRTVKAVFTNDLDTNALYDTEIKEISIASAHQLYSLSQQSRLGHDFAGYTITLNADIDMSVTNEFGESYASLWIPIADNDGVDFAGIFYYNGYTISGITVVIRNIAPNGIVQNDVAGLVDNKGTNSFR